MCDTIDIFCRSMKSDSDEWKRTEEFVIKSKDKLFDSFCVEVFFNAFSDEKIHMIDNETLDTMLWMIIPGLFEPPVRTLRATIPENESHIFR